MELITKAVPEIKNSQDSAQVPWKDAVVWVYNCDTKYYWLGKEHIRSVAWTGGNVSIMPKESSILRNFFSCFVVMSATVFVGTNVTAA
ncbi:MAG TPA: hypothetical protein PLL10_05285 [Elusimicrobiales bacterium]|nr:hypothetical protein [Elusimicrobiales bacterium]